MICKNCGGVLDFVNGHYECQSCGNVLHPEIVIQHFDVCICCIENDELGRRTQDSIIAQDVYQKLKFNNINAFFSRVDSADMIGDDLEISNDLAMFNSDVLIFVGIQKEHFEQLLEENKAKELNKIIIPVISKMNANDLPQELKSIQVMNYDNIGAISDLTNAVLKLLGREKEIELAKIHDKAAKKKKIITLCSVLVVLLIAASGTLYYVFGTDKVLDSKKYETAMTYVEKNDYVNALPILSALGDYQDCKKIISEYYKSFSGFYYDKDNSTGYRISINDDSVGIEIKKRDGIKTNTFSEAKEGVIFPIEFSYVDTENNQGIINVSLENDSIHFETKINEKVSDFCFDEGNHTFSKNDKTDEEANNATYKDYLNVLLDGTQTLDSLKKQGFKTKMLFEGYHGALPTYQIIDLGYSVVMDYDPQDDVSYVAAVLVPAGEIMPDKIGTIQSDFHDDEYIYLIDGTYRYRDDTMPGGGGNGFGYYEPEEEITSDTQIAIISKSFCDAYDKRMLEHDETYIPSKTISNEYEYYDSSWELLLSEFND